VLRETRLKLLIAVVRRFENLKFSVKPPKFAKMHKKLPNELASVDIIAFAAVATN
jgi:hypothetical protein